MNWITITEKRYNGRITHEIKCPICGLKVTYHGVKAPEQCYICNTELHRLNQSKHEAENEN